MRTASANDRGFNFLTGDEAVKDDVGIDASLETVTVCSVDGEGCV